MTSITYIGMDVHTTSYTLCMYSYGDDKAYAFMKTPARCEETGAPCRSGYLRSYYDGTSVIHENRQ